MTAFATNLLTILCAGAAAYFGAYLKKKGENLATHEDIGKLVDQMKNVTQATKEIEGKITDDFWGKQRRWELHRDILLAAIDSVADFQGDTNKLIALTHQEQISASDEDKIKFRELMVPVGKSLMDHAAALMRTRYRVALVSSSDIQSSINHISQGLLAIADVVAMRDFPRAVATASAVENEAMQTVTAIRAEFGFSPVGHTPQSSGSSAARAPDTPAPAKAKP